MTLRSAGTLAALAFALTGLLGAAEAQYYPPYGQRTYGGPPALPPAALPDDEDEDDPPYIGSIPPGPYGQGRQTAREPYALPPPGVRDPYDPRSAATGRTGTASRGAIEQEPYPPPPGAAPSRSHPQQAYPQPGSPQQVHPQQAYPQQQGYPQQQAHPQSGYRQPPQGYSARQGYPPAGYPPGYGQPAQDSEVPRPPIEISPPGATGSIGTPQAPADGRHVPPGTGGSRASVIAALPPEDQPEEGAPQQLPERFRRQLVDYVTKEPAGTIIIDTPSTYLYYVLGNGKAIRYGIGVGREGFTWNGVERVSNMKEWPDWHPPKEMIERQPYLPRFMAGGPSNPLGARALYLGKTIYRIHGTNQPSTIGQFVSSGCIRMINEDVEDLYGRVQVGTRVVVLPGGPPATAKAEPPATQQATQNPALPPRTAQQ